MQKTLLAVALLIAAGGLVYVFSQAGSAGGLAAAPHPAEPGAGGPEDPGRGAGPQLAPLRPAESGSPRRGVAPTPTGPGGPAAAAQGEHRRA